LGKIANDVDDLMLLMRQRDGLAWTWRTPAGPWRATASSRSRR